MSDYGFIPFCRKECGRIIKAIALAARNIPPKMNFPDYRFQINNVFCHSLSREFSLGGEGGTLRSAYSEGYDMIYADLIKISVKIQQEIFQKEKRNGELTCPKEIIMKNCLGGNNLTKQDLDLDFLVAIQRGKDKGDGKLLIGFGVISKAKLAKLIYMRKEDQIIAKMSNDKYDFYSGLQTIELVNDANRQSELNRVFSEGLSKTYDAVLSV